METSNFRSELHVAQQSRRDKLRVLQNHNTNPDQNAEIYGGNHLDQFSGGQHVEGGGTMNPDLVHIRPSFRYGNLSYEPNTVFSSDMLQYFAANSQALLVHHESDKRVSTGSGSGATASSFGNLSHNNTNTSAKMIYSVDPQNFGSWKSIPAAGGSGQESCDWVSCGTGIDGNHHNSVFAAEGLKANKNSSSSPAISTVYMKQQHFLNNYGYQDLRSSSSLAVPSDENIASHNLNNTNNHKHYGEMQFYHNNNNNNVVASQNARETGRVSNWSHTGNELVLLPAYADHSNAIDYSDSKATGGAAGLGTIGNDNSNTQVLSLSLSSVPSSKQHLGGGQTPEKPADYICSFNVKPQPPPSPAAVAMATTLSYSGKGCLENVDSTVVVGNSSGFPQWGSGPLGPFTGYATILKSSRFLRPAQQLMDEFCNILAPKSLNMLDTARNTITPSCDGVAGPQSAAAGVGGAGFTSGDSGGGGGCSSSTFFNSNDKINRQHAGLLASSNDSHKPEYLQKKAKLMYMQDEVCKRYKSYHQQMEMVVSSFETVAGLSAATPYLSLALNTVSRHFRSLRIAISDQLKNVRKALGEDLSSLTTGTSSTKGGDTSSLRQKVIDQTLQKQKTVSSGTMGFFEPQQHHVWRPQRGLPERAVAILRAWLFDHFLHPYPTDADKHMLASQTGLTRNQVSNWFINARVRVWKPMVEEIHTLETKAAGGGGVVGEAGPSGGVKTEGKGITDAAGSHHHHHRHSNDSQAFMNRLSDKQAAAAECSEMVSSTFTVNNRLTNSTTIPTTTTTTNTHTTWNDDDDHEKRSRLLLDCRIPGGGTTMDGSLLGFMPQYQQNGIDIGGLGAVSLTLGLRQNNADQASVQHENQFRRHFGDQIIYDFVG